MAAPHDPHPQFQQYAHPERLVSSNWLAARLGSPGLRVLLELREIGRAHV